MNAFIDGGKIKYTISFLCVNANTVVIWFAEV